MFSYGFSLMAIQKGNEQIKLIRKDEMKLWINKECLLLKKKIIRNWSEGREWVRESKIVWL